MYYMVDTFVVCLIITVFIIYPVVSICHDIRKRIFWPLSDSSIKQVMLYLLFIKLKRYIKVFFNEEAHKIVVIRLLFKWWVNRFNEIKSFNLLTPYHTRQKQSKNRMKQAVTLKNRKNIFLLHWRIWKLYQLYAQFSPMDSFRFTQLTFV